MNDSTEDLSHAQMAMAYYSGKLSLEEKAAFELHLTTCVDCQKLLAEAKANLPIAEAALAFTPKRSVDEQVAQFDAVVRAETERDTRRWMIGAYALAAAVVALMAFAAFEALKPQPLRISAAPTSSRLDAGAR
jgi:anti-sigma factor RsiW